MVTGNPASTGADPRAPGADTTSDPAGWRRAISAITRAMPPRAGGKSYATSTDGRMVTRVGA